MSTTNIPSKRKTKKEPIWLRSDKKKLPAIT